MKANLELPTPKVTEQVAVCVPALPGGARQHRRTPHDRYARAHPKHPKFFQEV